MSNKEIRIKAILDDSGIDKTIQDLQRRLNQITQQNQNINGIRNSGGQLSARAQYAQKTFQASTAIELQKESRQLEQKQRMEMQSLMKKQRELKEIEKLEGKITTEKQKQMEILQQEIKMKAQQVMSIEHSKNRINTTLGDIGGGNGGGGGASSGSSNPAQQGKAMQMFGRLLKSLGVASVLNGAINFAQHRLERDRSVLGDQGRTAQMSSRELRETVAGQGIRGMYFAGERRQAMAMAAREQSGMGNIDLARMGAGVASGAAAGAFVGGGIPGALVGGGLAFAGMMGGSKRLYNRSFDQDAYRQMLTREGMEKYEASRAMLEAQDPMKSIGLNSALKNNNRDIGLERALGIGTRGLYGQANQGSATPRSIQDIINAPLSSTFNFPGGSGLSQTSFPATGRSPLAGGLQGFGLDSLINPGSFNLATAGTGVGNRGLYRSATDPYGTGQKFSPEDVSRSVSSLVGAGATTEGARGLAGQALQFQRNLKLQNAPEVFGLLNSKGVEAGKTDDATLKIIAQGMKMGIVASQMPQELKKMVSVTAQLATKGGGFSNLAIEGVAAGLSGFDKSSIEGAGSAFEDYQNKASAAGGFEGQQGLGFLMGKGGEEAFGKVGHANIKKNSKLMNSLNQYTASYLQQNKALAKGLAAQAGVDVNTLIAGVRKKDMQKENRFKQQFEAHLALGEKTRGMSVAQRNEFLESDEGASLYARADMENVAAYGERYSKLGKSKSRARILAKADRAAGGSGLAGDDKLNEAKDILTGEVSGAEALRASKNQGGALETEAVSKHLDEIVANARQHSEASELYNIQFEKFVAAAKKSGNALEQMGGQIDSLIEKLTDAGIPVSGAPND